MTNSKTTKRALFSSIMALVLCFTMLLGTTYAWYTDTAETGMNEIIAGHLDVELVDEADNKVEGATDLFDEPELWEPGAVAYQQLQVKNVGSLDLKYSMSINYENVNSLNGHALSEVLKYAIIDLTQVDMTGDNNADREAVLAAAKASTNKGSLNDYEFVGELEAGQASDLQTLVVFWEPNADGEDNLYNANNGQKTSDGNPLQINLGVRVYATQLGGNGHEEDSFGPDYDLNAPTQVIVKSDATKEVYTSLADAIAEHGASNTFTVSGPIALTADLAGATATFVQMADSSPAIIDCTYTLGLSGANLTFDGVVIQGEDVDYEGLQHTASVTYKNCTILKSLTLYAPTVAFENCTFYLENRYIWTYSSDVTFDGCKFFNANSKAILVYHESMATNVTVEDCEFHAQAKGYTSAGAWTAAIEIDASLVNSGKSTVTISGSVADENYNGIVRVKNGADKVDVTADGAVYVTSQAALEEAIDDGAGSIILAAGEYGVIDVRVGRQLTLAAAGDGVKIAGINGQSNNNASDITIKGVTIDNSLQTAGWFTGTAPNINPCVGVWGGNYTFVDCTFYVTGASKAETGVMSWWTTNAGTMSFENCTFNGGNSSARAMQIYGNFDLEVENCTFNTAKDYSIKYVGDAGRTATLTNNKVNNTENFVQTGSAPYAGADYALVFSGNTLADGIKHVYVDNAENQTITVNGTSCAATDGAIY